jgi:hypothetical protein
METLEGVNGNQTYIYLKKNSPLEYLLLVRIFFFFLMFLAGFFWEGDFL